MKKFTKILAMVLTAATFVFMSCSPISGGVVKDETGNLGPGEKLINFTADSDGLFTIPTSVDSTARTITPEALDASTLKFYLVYRDTVNSANDSMEEITFNEDTSSTNITKGSFTKAFTLSDYTFKLYAVPSSSVTDTLSVNDVASKASFVGTANADLRYNDKVTFHMKANSLSTGKGSIVITIKHIDDWAVPPQYVVSASLKNIDNDTIVYPTTPGTPLVPRSNDPTKMGSKTFTGTNIAQGEYNLVVEYAYQPNAAGTTTKAYEYSEKVIVLMNQESKGTVEIPEILETAPVAPEKFVLLYQDPKDSSKNNYNVKFEWEDKSKNEREFIIQLLEFSDDAVLPKLPTSDDEWNDAVTGNTFEEYDRLTFDAADAKVAGSLNKGNTSITLTLPLEKRYAARICASNDAGKSKWAYVTWKTPGDADTGWTAFEADVTTINRFRINLNLNGGTFTAADADGTAIAADNIPALVYYASQHTDTADTAPALSTTHNVILSPDGITDAKYVIDVTGKQLDNKAKIVLSKDGNFFKNWSLGAENGKDYGATVTYEEAPATYIANIKYYPSTVTSDELAKTDALATQPTKDGFDNTDLKIRKAESPLYTGFKNLSLVANYDTTRTFTVEIDDITLYDLKPTYFDIAFKKDGTELADDAKIDFEDTIEASSITDLMLGATGTEDDPVKKVLEVSVAKVNNITITANASSKKLPISTYDKATNTIQVKDGTYDKIHLTVTAIDGKTKLIDQDWDENSQWDIKFKTWKLGKYHCELTANTTQIPEHTYSYVFTLDITQ